MKIKIQSESLQYSYQDEKKDVAKDFPKRCESIDSQAKARGDCHSGRWKWRDGCLGLLHIWFATSSGAIISSWPCGKPATAVVIVDPGSCALVLPCTHAGRCQSLRKLQRLKKVVDLSAACLWDFLGLIDHDKWLSSMRLDSSPPDSQENVFGNWGWHQYGFRPRLSRLWWSSTRSPKPSQTNVSQVADVVLVRSVCPPFFQHDPHFDFFLTLSDPPQNDRPGTSDSSASLCRSADLDTPGHSIASPRIVGAAQEFHGMHVLIDGGLNMLKKAVLWLLLLLLLSSSSSSSFVSNFGMTSWPCAFATTCDHLLGPGCFGDPRRTGSGVQWRQRRSRSEPFAIHSHWVQVREGQTAQLFGLFFVKYGSFWGFDMGFWLQRWLNIYESIISFQFTIRN